MRCHNARILMTKRLYEALAPEEGMALARHLECCPTCRAEQAEESHFEDRLRQAAATGRSAAVAAAAIDPIRVRDRWRRARLRPGVSPLLRLAAGAVAALGIAAVAGLRPHPLPSPVLTPGPPSPQEVPRISRSGARPGEPRLNTTPAPTVAAAPRPPRPSQSEAPPPPRWPPRAEPRVTAPAAGAADPAREPPVPSPVPDEEYLDGRDPRLAAQWMVGDPRDPEVLAWLGRQLPPMKDDFVAVPLPRLASADPDHRGLRAAIQEYEKEAGIVDARLFRKVTLQLKAVPLSDLCAVLGEQTQVRLSASRSVADENVAVFVKERPARDVLRAVARLFGYKWSRSGEEGEYRYELNQDLRAQLAEEELRSRDVHEALVALDEQLGDYRQYLDLTPAAAKARLARAQGREKELLAKVAGRGWGLVQVYHRLTPAQHLALATQKSLSFSTHPNSLELPLPAELRRPVLDSLGLRLGTFEGAPTIVDPHFGREGEGTLLSEREDASARVSLHLERSELGTLTLSGAAGGRLETQPDLRQMFMTRGEILGTATSPSVAKPDNARLNAKLRGQALFQRVVTVQPVPSCPWFVPGQRPQDAGGFHVETGGGGTLVVGPDGQSSAREQPHVTSGDVWEAVHRSTGLPVVADAYTRVYDLRKVTAEKQSLFDALCQVGDAMGARWQKDGAFLLARSTSYFWDKLKEVPSRDLRRWRENRRQQGFVPLEDLLEMATLTDAPLDSRQVGYVIGHCWGLEEWGIVGSGGAFRLGLPMGKAVRPYARFLATLNPSQRQRALGTAGLAGADLLPAQRESLARLVGGRFETTATLTGLRLHVAYAPVGTYVWHPVMPTSREADEYREKWPLVWGRTAPEALMAARRHFAGAAPDQVRRSRGVLCLRFHTASGESWQVGGPGVAFRINQ